MSFFIGCLIEAVAVIPIPIYWTPACYKGSFQHSLFLSLKGIKKKQFCKSSFFGLQIILQQYLPSRNDERKPIINGKKKTLKSFIVPPSMKKGTSNDWFRPQKRKKRPPFFQRKQSYSRSWRRQICGCMGALKHSNSMNLLPLIIRHHVIRDPLQNNVA